MTLRTTYILDGIWGRPRRFHRLRRALEECCGPTRVFEYDDSGRASFEQLGQQLAAEIRRHGQPVNVIGFSMGGLVIRAAHLLDPELPIHRAAFLNSPHRGSWLAYVLPRPGVRQMRPGSEFMRRLDAAPWNIPTLAVWCPLDLMVLPGRSARWHRASEQVRCWVPMHIWPVHSPGLHRRVMRFLLAEFDEDYSPRRREDTKEKQCGMEKARCGVVHAAN